MSVSKPRLQNPCKKFIEFNGQTGEFYYYDKEKKENVKMDMPVKFLFLDELNTVTGFSDQWQNGIYSNEVHDLSTQKLNVRIFKSPVTVVGKYKDIKGELVSMGGKFCKSIYALLFDNDCELVNLKLKGAAFGGWIEKGFNPEQQFAIEVSECKDGVKGAVKFKIPIFKPFEVAPSFAKKVMSVDSEILQPYFKEYENTKIEHEVIEDGYTEPPIVDGSTPKSEYTKPPVTVDSDLPF